MVGSGGGGSRGHGGLSRVVGSGGLCGSLCYGWQGRRDPGLLVAVPALIALEALGLGCSKSRSRTWFQLEGCRKVGCRRWRATGGRAHRLRCLCRRIRYCRNRCQEEFLSWNVACHHGVEDRISAVWSPAPVHGRMLSQIDHFLVARRVLTRLVVPLTGAALPNSETPIAKADAPQEVRS